jgi:hypothetical protein
MSFQLEKGDDLYRIVGPSGEEGEVVEYGVPATLVANDGNLYLAYCEDLDDDEQPDEALEGKIFHCVPVLAAVVEGVEFVDEDGVPLAADDDDDDDDELVDDDDEDGDALVVDDDDEENGELPAA